MTPSPFAGSAGTFSIGDDLPVHRLGFGAMRVTGQGVWGPPEDRSEALRVLQSVPSLGINFIDTADSYGPFVSEELIAEALHPYPDDLVIATKAGYLRPGPGQWKVHGPPVHLRERCEGSLRRLRVDTIDLLQLHRVDPDVPFEDQLDVLAELRHEGKVRHVGLSGVTLDQVKRARRHLQIVSVQNRFNIRDRASQDVLEYCEREGLAFIPWYPLAAGELLEDPVLTEAARAAGGTVSQLALAWLLHWSPAMLPIPGTGSVTHLEENTAAAELTLDPSVVRELGDRYAPVTPGFVRPVIRRVLAGLKSRLTG